ncbi:hypothetical protein [Streptomyces sp. 4F14]|uniref:hypothetical protein n=1 Tax=Streptomyces sp. 4F14 TaxID=3394380 RepID=UPI003A869A8A
MGALVFTALSVLLVSSCSNSEGGRDYATPGELCGISINPEDIEPFLPDGKSITVRETKYETTDLCKVIVDNKVVATASIGWVEKGKATSYFAALNTLKTLKEVDEGGRYVYSGNEAFGKTRTCVDARYGQELYTGFQFWGDEHKDADAMRRIIGDYTNRVEKLPECTEGAFGQEESPSPTSWR